MRGEDAFGVLGLRPGAGRADIDQAYRRLIKQHHPDASGGDAARAAEINRAYAVLRRPAGELDLNRQPPRAAGPVHAPAHAHFRQPGRQRGTMVGVLAIVAAVGIALGATMNVEAGRSWSDLSVPGTREDREPRSAFASNNIDAPLATSLIELAVGDARRLHGDGDVRLAAEFSRNCLSRLRGSPSVQQFDSCAAFDEAIAILMASDSEFAAGAFNPSAVSARQISAARVIDADYFDAEARFHRIRSRVQSLLLPGSEPRAQRRISEAEPAAPEPPVRVRLPDPPKTAPVPVPAAPRAIEPTSRPRQQAVRPPPPVVRRDPPRMPARIARPARAARNEAVRRPVAAPPRLAKVVTAPPRPVAEPKAAAPAPRREVPAWQKPIKPAWQRELPKPGK